MERCHQLADLAHILTLPADAPARQHLERCARCRTLARRYEDFLDPAPLPPTAAAEAASEALGQRLAAALPGPRTLLGQRSRSRGSRRRLERPLRRQPARPWFALAAVMILAVGFLTLRQQHLAPVGLNDGQAPVLRGSQALPDAPQLLEVSNGFQLSWQPHPASDRAVIVILDAELREIIRLPVPDSGRHHFAPGSHDGALTAQGRYLRVRFVLAGDVIDSTRTLPLRRAAS